MKLWVLTRQINAYDQDGAYYVAVFSKKPTAEQIANALGIIPSSLYIQHILNGGGREKFEDEWFNLFEEEAG
jgi:hypothetical protein